MSQSKQLTKGRLSNTDRLNQTSKNILTEIAKLVVLVSDKFPLFHL